MLEEKNVFCKQCVDETAKNKKKIVLLVVAQAFEEQEYHYHLCRNRVFSYEEYLEILRKDT